MTLNERIAAIRAEMYAWHEERPAHAVFWQRMHARLDELAEAHGDDPELDSATTDLLHVADVMGWSAPEESSMKTREELDRDLDALAAWVPGMLAETDEASQMDAFAGRADEISEHAGPEDQAHVWGRLQQILADNCLVPADEGPCS